jgi:hypothetical protein
VLLLGCEEDPEEFAGAAGAAVEGDVVAGVFAGLVDLAGLTVVCDALLGELL